MKVTEAGFNEHGLFHSWHTEHKGSRYADLTVFHNGKLVKAQKGKYGPDISVDFILDFLQRHKNEPTFVYYPMARPHWPMVRTRIQRNGKIQSADMIRTSVTSST
jgi:hypothetical protein